MVDSPRKQGLQARKAAEFLGLVHSTRSLRFSIDLLEGYKVRVRRPDHGRYPLEIDAAVSTFGMVDVVGEYSDARLRVCSKSEQCQRQPAHASRISQNGGCFRPFSFRLLRTSGSFDIMAARTGSAMFTAAKWSLQSALLSYVESPRRTSARRFLDGLSLDELEYIASFLGACVLECHETCRCTREQLLEWVRQFAAARRGPDEYKALLLYEFFCRSSLRQ
jgi:hypothetical protein